MEVLTLASALALQGLILALWWFADAARRLAALAALTIGSLAVGLTMAVHFVQLTAIRQLWRAGRIDEYRLVWPSPLFAVEYFVWDVLVGLTMISAGLALAGNPGARLARPALLFGGALCLVGVAGPISGRMVWQNVAVVGYAVVFPIAAFLIARIFRLTQPSNAAA